MRVHVLQHVAFEGIGSIQAWMEARQATLAVTPLFARAPLPDTDDFDWLIVMGGPMSVNDESDFPWLRPEKELIARAVKAEKTVLGICLGAQLIASAMGARVYRNPQKEIGWFPLRKTGGANGDIAAVFPRELTVFHWHGETFDLPPGAARFLESDACLNQAFALGSRVVGLQFHMETTPVSAVDMIQGSRADIVPGPTVQTEREMLAEPGRFREANRVMDSVLRRLSELSPP